MKENVLSLKKIRSRFNFQDTISDANYADERSLFVNTPVSPELLLSNLDGAVGVISLSLSPNKYIHLFIKWQVSVNQSTYLGSNSLSTSRDVDVNIGETWTAIERESTLIK